jgi:hypothetical protein
MITSAVGKELFEEGPTLAHCLYDRLGILPSLNIGGGEIAQQRPSVFHARNVELGLLIFLAAS